MLAGKMEPRRSPPDALFDPQFASNEKDFWLCKGLDKGGSMDRSKYKREYLAAWGKGKGKAGRAKGQLSALVSQPLAAKASPS